MKEINWDVVSIEKLEEILELKKRKINDEELIKKYNLMLETRQSYLKLKDEIEQEIHLYQGTKIFEDIYWDDDVKISKYKNLKAQCVKVKPRIFIKKCKCGNEIEIECTTKSQQKSGIECENCINKRKLKLIENEKEKLKKIEELKKIKTIPYNEYLQTEHWKNKSYKCKQLAGFKCQKCNSNKNLQVHHLTYERRGEEQTTDLMCLCDICHKKEHNILK
jgi:hypothetical protein